jgi:hypothetical protein
MNEFFEGYAKDMNLFVALPSDKAGRRMCPNKRLQVKHGSTGVSKSQAISPNQGLHCHSQCAHDSRQVEICSLGFRNSAKVVTVTQIHRSRICATS